MYPILYEQVTPGTIPATRGIGTLSSCSSCEVEQVRNDIYELVMEYPITGIHSKEIAYRRIIKAKPNFTDDPQLFRIDRIGKVMNGSFTVYAKHISYDLSGNEITSGTAGNAAEACVLLQNAAPGYNITTDKVVSGNFKINVPGSVRSYFAGREGSFLDVFGKADIKYDNFNIQFLTNAGEDRGITINYGKNLLELSQEIDASNLYTHVRCYYKSGDAAAVVGNKVATGLTLDVEKVLLVDVTEEYQEAPTVQTLTNRAQQYKNNNNLTVPSNNITLDFVQSDKLSNRVDLCDTVSVYYEALGITRTSMKCIRTKWDVIKEKYIETEFGDSVSTVADTIAFTNKALESKPSSSYMSEVIAHATELITGNLGGYVILHDSNGDGTPDEILIMDTADINTATKVWRWNKNGLGYSSTGYSGTFGTAITADGKIVADYIATGTLDASQATITNINASNINTGTLNADLIKAGTISDVAGNSSINMTNGVATMKNFKAKDSLTLVDSSNIQRAWIGYTVGSGSALRAMDGNGHALASMDAQNNGYGMVAIGDSNKEQLGTFSCNSAGAGIYLASLYSGLKKTGAQLFSKDTGGLLQIFNNPDQNLIAEIGTGSDRSGHLSLWGYVGQNLFHVYRLSGGGCYMALFKDDTTQSIYMNAYSGAIVCVSLTQTSSRKVKKNIKPIEDAEKILELQAVSFDYKDESLGTNKRGFIAEDVAEVLPNLVTPETEEHNATLDYMEMIPYLQAVIKKQEERITALEKKIESLEK